jgi:hypothetical protein
MDVYKLSCPRCGQHIEYTRDYCGRQVQCPSCNGNVTFPAIPPLGSGRSTLRLERDRPKVKEPFRIDFAKILASIAAFFRTFEHWQIVLMCALPFIFIAIALATARFVRNQDSQAGPKQPIITEAQIAENQRIAELNKADAIVQDRVRNVWAAKTALDTAKAKSANWHRTYDGKQLSEGTRKAVDAQFKVAEEEIATADANLNAWRRSFDTEYQKYQKLGGKIDYTSQLPR